MNNNGYLVKKFEESQKIGVPTFLCGTMETGDAVLAYLAVTPTGDNVKLIINYALEDEILVGLIDVGVNMICEFGKYVMLFDEDAYCHIYNYISLCDKSNAVFTNRKNVDKMVNMLLKEHQEKTGIKLQVLTIEMLLDLMWVLAPDFMEEYKALLEECKDEDCPHCAAMKRYNGIEDND